MPLLYLLLAVGLACGYQRRVTGNGSALEVLHDNALYKSTYFTLILKPRDPTIISFVKLQACDGQTRRLYHSVDNSTVKRTERSSENTLQLEGNSVERMYKGLPTAQ